ncbi:MAG: tetratricopeptide repeat protein [Acidobacteriota bacterium]|nr:tetratricopeptide repeat protein [Acidobacteriota bacterium]
MKTKKSAHGISSAVALTGALLLVPALASASGSSPMRMPAPQAQASPEQEAASLYNDGISYRDKAAKFEKEAAAEPDAAKAGKLLAKARDRHESSIKPFQAATKKNPALFQAWGSLGYAYRKVGNYPASLEAYGKALEIEPNYTPAIEYRAEAYLALNRLDEVKTVYITLFNMDRPRADELGAAIEKWLEGRKADPAGVDPSALADFSKWQEERKKLASQTSSLTTRRNEAW